METPDTTLSVRIAIPFGPSGKAESKAMLFLRWIPQTEEQSITVSEDEISVKFWFDHTDTALGRNNVNGVELDLPLNVMAERIMADLTITGLSQRLVEYTIEAASLDSAGQQPSDDASPLAEECRKLACRLLDFTLRHFNRLVSYVYSVKGQFWLEEYPFDPDNAVSHFIRFGVKVKRPAESEWQRFYVPGLGGVIRAGYPDKSRYVTKEDWSRIQDLMASHSRPPLVWQLLARADWLSACGHRRSALTETVSALEVAVHAFSRSPCAERAFGTILGARLRLSSLSQQVQRIGLSGTVKYLLPMIFPEEKLPTEVLKGCQEAVEERQNVIHNGKRDVDPDRTVRYLASIRKLCSILEWFSDHAAEV